MIFFDDSPCLCSPDLEYDYSHYIENEYFLENNNSEINDESNSLLNK